MFIFKETKGEREREMEHGERSGSGSGIVFGGVKINWAESKLIEADFNWNQFLSYIINIIR